MGAEGVVNVYKGKTAAAAYNAAVQEARYEYGSGGYTGSIAESSGHFVYQQKPVLRWEAENIANQLLSDDEVSKWGPTAFIPVAEATGTRQVTVTIDTTGMDYDKMDAAILTAIKAKLRVGESIAKVDTTTDKKTKIVTTAPEGETKTVYFLKGKGGKSGTQYATLAEAKAAAKAAMEKDNWYALYITKQVTKGGNAALVTFERKVVKATTKIVATVGKPKAGPVDTWVAAGWYSS